MSELGRCPDCKTETPADPVPDRRLLRCPCCRTIHAEEDRVVLVNDYRGAVEERDDLRLMLTRLLDVALVDGYGETVADEARALLARIGGR
jgi:hypothetical protein